MKYLFTLMALCLFSSCFASTENTINIDGQGWVSRGCILETMRHTPQEIDPISR